jgi:hypothetical protein
MLNMTVFVANTNVLELLGLKSAIEGTFINDATVAVTVKDKTGTNVTGETWPLSMAYVTTSNGNYRAILKDTLPLANGQKYKAHVTADGGANRKGSWVFEFKALTRSSEDGDS